MGIDIITKVLRVPCTQIANNAGKDGAQVAESLLMKEGDYGYDAREDKFVFVVDFCLFFFFRELRKHQITPLNNIFNHPPI